MPPRSSARSRPSFTTPGWTRPPRKMTTSRRHQFKSREEQSARAAPMRMSRCWIHTFLCCWQSTCGWAKVVGWSLSQSLKQLQIRCETFREDSEVLTHPQGQAGRPAGHARNVGIQILNLCLGTKDLEKEVGRRAASCPHGHAIWTKNRLKLSPCDSRSMPDRPGLAWRSL